MKRLVLIVLMAAVVMTSGCAQINQNATNTTGNQSGNVSIESGNRTYPAYLAVPSSGERSPGIVLIHSFNGLEPGYRVMADMLASEGFVVLEPQWQTFNQSPSDPIVGQIINDSAAYLSARQDVDPNRLGLTGFCAGGRYTMLFLPQISEFKAGVAWYGFPYSGPDNSSRPVDFIDQLQAPMLIIHGTNDRASNIQDIYRYATALNASGKYFEMKIYQGQGHGFMIDNGQLSQSFPAQDAYREMATFFNRTLKA